ncbi:MAG: MATE family efflux transporter, partial [Lachnospiraceae bacterium]|nr:MATE family efflux transporter [Lachnospiraceae bacterium]
LVGLCTRAAAVLAAGCAYLRSYSFDTLFAAVHFCFSGYFCGDQKAGISFLHNITAILLVRIPGAYLASVYFPDSLYPMGWAAPLGSLLSALICVGFYLYFHNAKSTSKDVLP